MIIRLVFACLALLTFSRALSQTADSLAAVPDSLPMVMVEQFEYDAVRDLFSPFNLSLGSNFDFIGKFGLTDLYFNASSFNPDVFTLRGRDAGFDVGVRRSRTEAYDNFTGLNTSHSIDPGAFSPDSVTVYKYVVESTSNLELVNTNFYLTPFVNVLDNRSAGSRKRIYLGLNFELMKQELYWTYALDTVDIQSFQASAGSQDQYAKIYLKKQDKTDQNIYYLGVSAPIIIENEQTAFFCKPGAGYSQILQAGAFDNRQLYVSLEMEFYERKLGLNLRAEYRYFGQGRAPFLGFTIAKLLNLEKLVDVVSR